MQDVMQHAGQRFTVSHFKEADFKAGGLRNYSSYRDLGVAAATNGLAQAHVIRMIKPFSPELSERHHHDVTFQMAYVLKGWFSTEFDDHGVQVFREGSCWVQPPGIRHTVRGWSDDCEILEIIMPAEHTTVVDP
jgi:mannose-6-phosphate isomerase-like protein (cupin superfamily)